MALPYPFHQPEGQEDFQHSSKNFSFPGRKSHSEAPLRFDSFPVSGYNNEKIMMKQEVICIIPYTYETTVTYSDIGPDLRLCHRGLLRVMQEAAAIDSQNHGYGLLNTEETGLCWILAGWRLEQLERPVWNTPLSVQTWPRTMEGFFSDRDFALYAEGRLAARGTSHWLLVNVSTGRIARITDQVRGAYELGERAMFDTPIPSNSKSALDARETFSTVVTRRDIDTNHHVNNIHYLDYALEALPEEALRDLPPTVEIIFRKQILLGASIRCLTSVTEDGKYQVEIQSGQGKDTIHHAFVWFY